MCPTIETISLDDPAFEVIYEYREPYHNNPAARILHDHGYENKAYALASCGKVWTAVCAKHSIRKRKRFSCNDRFCPNCNPRIVSLTKKRNARMLTAIRKLPGHAVLCRVRYLCPHAIDDIHALRPWLDRTFAEFRNRWNAYVDSFDSTPHHAHVHLVTFAGIERDGDREYFVCYALGHFHDAQHRPKLQAIWQGTAHDAQVDRGRGYLFESFFERAFRPADGSYTGPRRAYHEILFHGAHSLCCSRMDSDLFTKEAETHVNKSAEAATEAGTGSGAGDSKPLKKPPQWPRVPCHCDICGALCTTSLENPGRRELFPIREDRLSRLAS